MKRFDANGTDVDAYPDRAYKGGIYVTQAQNAPTSTDLKARAVAQGATPGPHDEVYAGRLDPDDLSIEALRLEVRLLRRYVERLALCPDHRDKGTGWCVVCQAEKRTREELRSRD